MRRHLTRFQPEHFAHNLALVKSTSALAERKGITPAQLALAWVARLGPHVVPIPGSSKAARTLENLGAADVVLSDAEAAELDAIIARTEIKGGRYNDAANHHLWG
jgi:pyridoxine 4-dehydrogenase